MTMDNEAPLPPHNENGEIISPIAPIDTAALAVITRTEIDVQVATARQFPRSVDRSMKNIITLATLDEETAEECCYALVRKSKRRGNDGDNENKPIEGPSIRLAEIAAQSWGNCRIDARVIAVNRIEKYVEAEGTFHDLETNMASRATVRRRISTREGPVFGDDMIVVTGNAACAIAKRNAILAGVPRGIYRPAYQRARAIIAGTAETLTQNRAKAIDAFKRFGVMPEQLFDVLGVEGEADITVSHIATLRAMFSTLKNGEATVEEMFGPAKPDHKVVDNPLSDEAPAAPTEIPPNPAAAERASAEELRATAQRDAAAAVDQAQRGLDRAAGRSRSEKPAEPEKKSLPDVDEGPDKLAIARARGREARAKKMSIKAVPPEYREDGRLDEATAWKEGHAEIDQAQLLDNVVEA